MNLCIDIGNTTSKFFLFRQDQLWEFSRHFPEKHLNKVKKAIISVTGRPRPDLEKRLEKHSIPYIYNNAKLKMPFRINYETPETLGPDRLALAAGAMLTANPPCLIIDAGTCITYDFIDQNKQYSGGAISPGLSLRYKSLHDYTAALPLLSVPDKNPALTGRSTEASIHSGVFNGWISEIEGIISRYKKLYPDIKVIITGGDAERLAKSIKISIFAVDKFLQARGLNEILNLNL